MSETVESVLSQLLNCLSTRWEATLTRFAGAAVKVSTSNETAIQPDKEPVWITVSFEGLLTGDAALVMSAAGYAALANKTESAAETAPTEGSTGPAEALRQTFIMALNDFQEQHGQLVGHIQVAEAPTWTATKTFRLDATCSEPAGSLGVTFLCGPTLAIATTAQSSSNQPSAVESRPTGGNLDRVMDAALEVTLRFGRQQLTLAQLAELGPGSVLELDRKVQEPVELVLDGQVLARGDVMVVDGNYGLRVTELVERRERC